MGRGGFGFNVINFSERIVLRSKILGSVNFIMDTTSEGLNVDGYRGKDVNDSFLSEPLQE
jgi:hypothetical protein